MGTLLKRGPAGAALAGVTLLLDALLGLLADTDDHSSAAGAASEVLFALSLLGAALVVLHLGTRHRHLLVVAASWVSVIALVLMAATSVSVPIRGQEPGDTWSSLIGFGVLGALVVGLAWLAVATQLRVAEAKPAATPAAA